MKKHTNLRSFVATGFILGAMVLAPLGAMLAQADAGSTVNVTVVKMLDGHAPQNLASFPMSSNWNSQSTGFGSSNFMLGPIGVNNASPYQQTSTDLSMGGSYTMNEVLDGSYLGTDCWVGSNYALIGYSTGDTLSEAMSTSSSTVDPSFNNLTSNKYVVVWNKSCAPTGTTSITHNVHVRSYLDRYYRSRTNRRTIGSGIAHGI
jgi:hypothetical protein